jgi:hypothetical protein
LFFIATICRAPHTTRFSKMKFTLELFWGDRWKLCESLDVYLFIWWVSTDDCLISWKRFVSCGNWVVILFLVRDFKSFWLMLNEKGMKLRLRKNFIEWKKQILWKNCLPKKPSTKSVNFPRKKPLLLFLTKMINDRGGLKVITWICQLIELLILFLKIISHAK